MFDPIVLDSRQTLMQRIADYVRTGHVFWTSGDVSLERATVMVQKFARLYAVHRDRNQRFRARRLGEASAVLLLFRAFETERVEWFLLCTEGDNPARQLEQLRDASTKVGRVRVGEYELAKLNKPAWPRHSGTARATVDVPAGDSSGHRHEAPTPGKTVLTWRIHSDVYEGYRERALHVARQDNPHALQQFIADIYRVAGFFGIRHQVGKVVALARREYRRRHGSLTGFPVLPRLYFVRRRPNRGTRLTRLSMSRRNSGPTEPNRTPSPRTPSSERSSRP